MGIELLADSALPTFYWLRVTGNPGENDFGLTHQADLIISTHALETLRNTNIDNCDVEPWPSNH